MNFEFMTIEMCIRDSSMTEHEKYQEHIRHTHDAFCKTVIRHAAIDAARSLSLIHI